ncbi:MAG: prolipoprotein diacylglyceryl transferase [Planctomycetaceae bacterium]|jgi:phosphatidylglycerol:prolipoprotein diacylglycerol transferase|nr:prolipoprotein diacylglyceryl transferase [Planctomycetaceae bacterium]
MLQTLFYIPPQFFGVPVFGFGWLLGILAAGTAVMLLVPQLRRRTSAASTLFTAGIIAALLFFVFPNLIEPPYGIPIRGYGACLLLAIFAALTLVIHLAKQRNIAAESAYSLCLWAVVCGIAGARLFYVTEYWQELIYFDADGHLLIPETLWSVLNIAGGGLVVFGSIIGGIIGCTIFIRRNALPFFAVFDALAPALMLGIAVGRIGCFLNGCCFGGVCEEPWAVTFPAGSPAHIHQIEHGKVFYDGLKFQETDGTLSIAEVLAGSPAADAGMQPGMLIRSITAATKETGEITPVSFAPASAAALTLLLQHLHQLSPNDKVRFDIYTNAQRTAAQPYYVPMSAPQILPVHPTQLYSSAAAFAVCGILLALNRLPFYRCRSGLVFASFLIIYAVVRFGIEIIRTDEDSFLGTGLTVSQNISILFAAAGIVLFVYLITKSRTSV